MWSRAFRDMVLGRLDPADAYACTSMSDGTYAVQVAARAAHALSGREQAHHVEPAAE